MARSTSDYYKANPDARRRRLKQQAKYDKTKKAKKAMKSNSKTNNKMKLQRSKRVLNPTVNRTLPVNPVMKNSRINRHWSNGFGELKMILANYYEENSDTNTGSDN